MRISSHSCSYWQDLNLEPLVFQIKKSPYYSVENRQCSSKKEDSRKRASLVITLNQLHLYSIEWCPHITIALAFMNRMIETVRRYLRAEKSHLKVKLQPYYSILLHRPTNQDMQNAAICLVVVMLLFKHGTYNRELIFYHFDIGCVVQYNKRQRWCQGRLAGPNFLSQQSEKILCNKITPLFYQTVTDFTYLYTCQIKSWFSSCLLLALIL